MALIRWQPFGEIEQLRRQMDQMFDDISGINGLSQVTFKPAIELTDDEENLVLRAEVPGVEAKDLDISVGRDAVTIKGEHRYQNETQEKGFYHSEFRYGKFERTIKLPVAVQNDHAKAEFNNGILTLTLPKVAEAQHRVVKVSLTEPNNKSRSENQ